MPFDEREIIQQALEQAAQEFMEIMDSLLRDYPDVAHRGVEALLIPQPTPADERKMRQTFEDAQTPEEFLAMLDQALAGRSEEEVFSALLPQRRTPPPDEEEIDAYGPRL